VWEEKIHVPDPRNKVTFDSTATSYDG
jgi:hypothetical protein